ncbi:hypothetical protein [Aliarcobacter butzleri]|uniref:hypothetical protein n=1 Tax=Aliarcobacter butzleri TaxID=28197 RepID=UPI00263D8F0C|nr:hypothetical protein [Aliarcobacter butzleri]MDN5090989.1 hypothetical protein [Aliarcobacter butzleri]
MKNITNYLLDFTEELGKEGYSIVKAGVKTLYKAKGELAVHAIQSYMNTRFEIRLEDFAYEQEKLSKEQKENFYKNINHKKLNFLFELLENARTTAYDLHAKILSKLYGNFLRKGELDYHEKTLLSNIDILNDEDLKYFHKVLNTVEDINISEIKKLKINFPIKSYSEHYIFEKLVRVGLLIDSSNIDAGTIGGKEFILNDRAFYIHNFTVEMYNLLTVILGDKHSS